jgi:peroxiredoxin Q/BCP
VSLPEAQPAPAFDLPDQTGARHRLSDYRGKYVVLYFYPKDDTPGCTREACDFRDHIGHLRELGAEVLGVSADDETSHAAFHGKYGLNFPLLADDGARLAHEYSAYGKKNVFGKEVEGIIRKTFLIDPEGRIVRAWNQVSVDGHVQEVEAALREARGA